MTVNGTAGSSVRLFSSLELSPCASLSLISCPQGECTEPFDYIDATALKVIWNVIYWTSYVATWAVYPMMQSYVVSGEFTLGRKLWAGLKENALWYAVAGAVGIVVFVILWVVVGIGNLYSLPIPRCAVPR